jgi:pre-mRNA-splicing factor SYF2
MMAKEVEERINKRNQFSRRRAYNEDRDVSAINDRNERFNKKLERNYSKYAAEIKSNLERGTAL